MRLIDLSKIKDNRIKEELVKINEDVIRNPLLQGEWRRLELMISAAGNHKIKHNLPFTPSELIVSFNTTTGLSITYGSFDKEFIYLVTTSSGIIKGFIGKFADKQTS